MKVTCQREEILSYLAIVTKAVGGKSPNPILDCVLITANGKGLFLTCTNLNLGIETSAIPANIIEEGEVAVDARFFNDIIRQLGTIEISISSNAKGKIIITSGNSKYDVLAHNPSDFPELPDVQQDNKYSISQLELKNMLRQTIFSISADTTKPVYTGELFEFVDNRLNMITIDGYRVSYRSTELLSSAGENEDIIVMGKNLQELSKILSSNEEDVVEIYIGAEYVLFDVGSARIYSQLLSGKFLDYSQSFNVDYVTEVVLDRNEFLQCINRASLVSYDDRKTPIKINVRNNMIEITAKSDTVGQAFEEMACEVDGYDVELGFSSRYMKDAIKAIEDDMIRIRFGESLSPCVILPVEGEEFKYLVLPLRV